MVVSSFSPMVRVILMRPSGTEPVVRLYAEAATPEASDKLAQDAQQWINTGNAPGKS